MYILNNRTLLTEYQRYRILVFSIARIIALLFRTLPLPALIKMHQKSTIWKRSQLVVSRLHMQIMYERKRYGIIFDLRSNIFILIKGSLI